MVWWLGITYTSNLTFTPYHAAVGNWIYRLFLLIMLVRFLIFNFLFDIYYAFLGAFVSWIDWVCSNIIIEAHIFSLLA